MFPIDKLRYKRIADIPAGNLIYVFREAGLALALRVEHPPGSTGAVSFPAAVVLHDEAQGRRMPLTDPGLANQRCIDWGVRPVVRWNHPLAIAPRGQRVSPDPGYLLLVGDEPVLSSFYTGGRGDRLHWNLVTGGYVDLGGRDFCIITAWSLGANSGEGTFVELAAYPRDYEPRK
jgi:hypothetical protein